MIINTSHLRKNYTIDEMAYLDGSEASVLYKTIASIIVKHNLKEVVDVGCRTGEINKYLSGYDYLYYGFDTSTEPIEYAKSKYRDKIFEVNDWDNLHDVGFCDVLVFGSVLIYSDKPTEMFERICNFYKPKHAIIHEVNNKNNEDLNYINLKYFDKYQNEKYEFNLDIPVGNRTIIDVQYQ